MNRTILVIVLILGLCQGFWHQDQESFFCWTSHDELSLKELVSFGGAICNSRPILRFAGIFASNKYPSRLAQFYRQKISQRPAVAWLYNAPGQNRRIDDAIHPIEWGLVVLRLPRSDG